MWRQKDLGLMRYFKHNIGDWAAATQHLSFVEDAAYHRMIRHYYATEKPLLSDLKALARVLGARTKEEKEAIGTIANEFFTLEDDGWHQRRCDVEILLFQEKSSKASASGKKGGRPRRKPNPLEKNETIKADALIPESERFKHQKLPTTHYPLPTNHESKDTLAAASLVIPPTDAAAAEGPQAAMVERANQDAAFAGWQALSAKYGWPDAMFLTSTRRFKLQAILAICDGLEGWKAALVKAATTANFLKTADEQQWQPWFNFDWLINIDNFTKLMEGRYAERHTNEKPGERSLLAGLAGLAEGGAR